MGLGTIFGKIAPYIPVVLDLAKTLMGDIGERKPVDASSTADDIGQLVKEFESYKADICSKIFQMETEVQKEVQHYIDECIEELSAHEGVLKKYDIRLHRIENHLKKINTDLKKNLEADIDKEVSMGNQEFMSILRMLPGKRKQDAMGSFIEKTFRKILDQYYVKIKEKLSDLSEELEERILMAVKTVVIDIKHQFKEMEALKNDKNQEKAKIIAQESEEIFAECDVLEKVLVEAL